MSAVTISVIVPGLNVVAMIQRCLRAIGASDYPILEVLFFDDGSSDASGVLAAHEGARVIRNSDLPLGPGLGRNAAAIEARGELLMFVDSDVVIRPDTIRLLVEELEQGSVAAFGSYDDSPPERNLASLYANLRHHFVHQNGSPISSTFWAGIGLIRKDAFLAAGGFSSRYGRPSIEDIDLGARLVEQGFSIRLQPRALGTHLKHWSPITLWRTDIFARALPWARLIASGRTSGADLNGAGRERVAAVLAHLILLAAVSAAFSRFGLVALLAAMAVYLAAIGPFLLVLARRLPLSKLPGAVALHWLYHIYASQIFGWTLLASKLKRTARAQKKPL